MLSIFEIIFIGLPTLTLWGIFCFLITLVIMLVISPVVAIALGIKKVDDNRAERILDTIAMIAYIIVFFGGPFVICAI